MTTDNKAQILAWTTFPLWIIIVASLLLEMMMMFIGLALVGGNLFEGVVEGLGRVDVIVRVVLLIAIPIAFFFAARRLEKNLPPEEHVTDRMNIGENETEPQSEDCGKI